MITPALEGLVLATVGLTVYTQETTLAGAALAQSGVLADQRGTPRQVDQGEVMVDQGDVVDQGVVVVDQGEFMVDQGVVVDQGVPVPKHLEGSAAVSPGRAHTGCRAWISGALPTVPPVTVPPPSACVEADHQEVLLHLLSTSSSSSTSKNNCGKINGIDRKDNGTDSEVNNVFYLLL